MLTTTHPQSGASVREIIICYESFQKYLWYMMKSLMCRPETQSLLFIAVCKKPGFSCTGSISHVSACSNLPTETFGTYKQEKDYLCLRLFYMVSNVPLVYYLIFYHHLKQMGE